MGKRRAGSGLFGLGDLFTKKDDKSRGVFRSKSMMDDNYSFSPGENWRKGESGGRSNISGSGTYKRGRDVYKMENQYAIGGSTLGGNLKVYGGSGSGDASQFAAGADAMYDESAGGESREAWRLGDHLIGGLAMGGSSRDPKFVEDAYRTGVISPYKKWIEGEYKESTDWHGFKGRDLPDSFKQDLESRNIDTPTGMKLTKDFDANLYDEMVATREATRDSALASIRDIWISDEDLSNLDDDDPMVQAQTELRAKAEEMGLSEADIFGDTTVATGTAHMDVEEGWDAAQGTREFEENKLARERIKQNLQGQMTSEQARSQSGASGLEYSGAHQRGIETSEEAARMDMRDIQEREAGSLGTIRAAEKARSDYYTGATTDALGAGGQFNTYDLALQDFDAAQGDFLQTAMDSLGTFGGELDKLLDYGPEGVVKKDKKTKMRDRTRNMFYGSSGLQGQSFYQGPSSSLTDTQYKLGGLQNILRESTGD